MAFCDLQKNRLRFHKFGNADHGTRHVSIIYVNVNKF